jgi:phage gp16-like protein
MLSYDYMLYRKLTLIKTIKIIQKNILIVDNLVNSNKIVKNNS